jgi:hypothetical protein
MTSELVKCASKMDIVQISLVLLVRLFLSKTIVRVVCWCALVIIPVQLKADTNTLSPANTEFDHLTIDDLLEVDLTSVTGARAAIREAPGIVTVITQEQIRNSGARDFID